MRMVIRVDAMILPTIASAACVAVTAAVRDSCTWSPACAAKEAAAAWEGQNASSDVLDQMVLTLIPDIVAWAP